jgi:arsenate reductase
MKATVYMHPKCSTCKKAQQFLEKNKLAFTVKDITAQAPSLEELTKMLAVYNGDIKKLFNTSGIQYREMSLSQKIPQMSEKEALKLLASNGMLVKRPFLIEGEAGLVGFNEEQWKKVCLK